MKNRYSVNILGGFCITLHQVIGFVSRRVYESSINPSGGIRWQTDSRRMGIAKFSISSIYILLFAAFFVLNMAVPVYGQYDVETLHVEKPRIIILTDITNEPDDQQ